MMKSLNAKHVVTIIIVICCVVLLEAGYGIHQLQVGYKHQALFYCLLASFMFSTLPIHVSKLLRIKKTGAIIVKSPPFPVKSLPRIPFFISAAFAILLTVAVTVVSYHSFFASLITYPSRPLRWDMAGFNLCLWLLVGLIWYCLIATKEQEQHTAIKEQPEGIWPPAPLTADIDKFED